MNVTRSREYTTEEARDELADRWLPKELATPDIGGMRPVGGGSSPKPPDPWEVKEAQEKLRRGKFSAKVEAEIRKKAEREYREEAMNAAIKRARTAIRDLAILSNLHDNGCYLKGIMKLHKGIEYMQYRVSWGTEYND